MIKNKFPQKEERHPKKNVFSRNSKMSGLVRCAKNTITEKNI